MSKGGGGTKTVETSSRPDPVVQEYGYQNLQLASELASQPYIPWQGGDRIAGFDPMEQTSFDQVRGLDRYFGQDLGYGQAQGLAQGLSSAALGMTPGAYNQAVQGALQG